MPTPAAALWIITSTRARSAALLTQTGLGQSRGGSRCGTIVGVKPSGPRLSDILAEEILGRRPSPLLSYVFSIGSMCTATAWLASVHREACHSLAPAV